MITHRNIPGANGVNLHAAMSGDRGPLMIFLHGFPEFWLAWHAQLSAFSTTHRTVALDLRGYNLSDKPPNVADYALRHIIDDVRHVMDALSPNEPVILVGHDWGGIVAWFLARENPERLAKLIIINAPHPVIFYRELKHSWRQRFASSYAGFFQLRGIAETALTAFDFAGLRTMVFGTSSRPCAFTPQLRKAYREAWSVSGAVTGGLNYYRNPRALRALLKHPPGWLIHVPTLVLWGELDPALLTGNLEGLELFVPRVTVRRHREATHWIVHEDPIWVNESIRAFLERGS